MNYQIITDTCCDYPMEMYAELGLKVVPLSVHYKNQDYNSYSEQWLKGLFDGLRAGEVATTSAVNPAGWTEHIEPVLAAGQDALVLSFSSGLSTTYQSAVIAAEELKEKYPDRTVNVVDTLCASLGQGLLVYYACQKRDAGMSLTDLTEWCEKTKHNLCHWVTADDLMYLKRGGRVSAATAVAGTLLQIKPIIHMNEEGKLISVGKARGRKAAIQTLCNKVGELGIEGANDTIFICHGDCLEDAQTLEKMLKEKYGTKKVFIYYIGAVIGSHAGPGTMAVFFLGEHR